MGIFTLDWLQAKMILLVFVLFILHIPIAHWLLPFVNAVIGMQRGSLGMVDRIIKLGVSMRMMLLHLFEMGDGCANQRLQMSDVDMIFMVMANMLMGMIGHDDGMVTMLGMMSDYGMRHDSLVFRVDWLSHRCGGCAGHGWHGLTGCGYLRAA